VLPCKDFRDHIVLPRTLATGSRNNLARTNGAKHRYKLLACPYGLTDSNSWHPFRDGP